MKIYNHIDGMAVDAEGQAVAFIEGKPRLFNGESVFEFDNKEERTAYLNSLPQLWSKEAYAAEINAAHDALYRQLWASKNYLGNWEVLSAALQSDVYNTEANAILKWYWDSYAIIEQHLATVTEQTALSIEDFISQLPQFIG